MLKFDMSIQESTKSYFILPLILHDVAHNVARLKYVIIEIVGQNPTGQVECLKLYH